MDAWCGKYHKYMCSRKPCMHWDQGWELTGWSSRRPRNLPNTVFKESMQYSVSQINKGKEEKKTERSQRVSSWTRKHSDFDRRCPKSSPDNYLGRIRPNGGDWRNLTPFLLVLVGLEISMHQVALLELTTHGPLDPTRPYITTTNNRRVQI